VINSIKTRWASPVASIEDTILLGNPEEKNHSEEISGDRRTELRYRQVIECDYRPGLD
jgi:hypothetical protein